MPRGVIHQATYLLKVHSRWFSRFTKSLLKLLSNLKHWHRCLVFNFPWLIRLLNLLLWGQPLGLSKVVGVFFLVSFLLLTLHDALKILDINQPNLHQTVSWYWIANIFSLFVSIFYLLTTFIFCNLILIYGGQNYNSCAIANIMHFPS